MSFLPSRLTAALPSARTLALAIGAARVGVGVSFLAAPVVALRILGVDSGTAGRVTWLSQMTAARDGVIGAGTVAAASRGGSRGWLVAGAVADATDAAALTVALRGRRIAGPGAVAMIFAAGATAVAGGIAAARS